MSIETLTGDEFMCLTSDEHREALDLYATAINQQASVLVCQYVGTADHDAALDKLSRLATLRKVHKVRLEELEGEEPAGLPASEQYRVTELAPALA